MRGEGITAAKAADILRVPRPPADLLAALSESCAAGAQDGLALDVAAQAALRELGIEAG